MHIPQHMLDGKICSVTLAISILGIGSAVYAYKKSQNPISPIRWAAVTALLFSLQMFNFPIMDGISGHLVGGILAVSLLGIPAAILSMTMVLVTQALFFNDGGLDVLGANLLNMALIATGFGGLILKALEKRRASKTLAIGIASFLSICLAMIICSLEVAGTEAVALSTMVRVALPVHIILGATEAILTLILLKVLNHSANSYQEKVWNNRTLVISFFTVFIAALVKYNPTTLNAFNQPDGLEWTFIKLNLSLSHSATIFAWLKDYRIVFIQNTFLSTLGAGILGIGLIWIFTLSMAKKLGFKINLG